jgi:hypothetical protein
MKNQGQQPRRPKKKEVKLLENEGKLMENEGQLMEDEGKTSGK